MVLGVHVTAQLIEAVLLQQAGDHVQVLRRFVRQRGQSEEFTTAKSLAKALPGLLGDDADYSLEMGNGSGSLETMFLESEFAGAKKKGGGEAASTRTVQTGAGSRTLFAAQLAEILDECKRAGHEAPKIAFCIVPPDVSYTELEVAPPRAGDRGKKARQADRTASRRTLLGLLAEAHAAPFDAKRTAFIPMHSDGEALRYLAIVPEPGEPVSGTLSALKTQDRVLPRMRLLDAEVAVYARLARRVIPPDQDERHTAIVRVGSEDTLVLFFIGRELRHYERLRSLSTHDAPETVCSRVMLQQDEQKIGELHHVLVVTEGNEGPFVTVCRRLFAEAAVETLQDVLAGLDVRPPRGADGFTGGSIPAIAVGLRLLLGWDRDDPDLNVHLLPEKMQRERKKLALAWHTIAMLGLLMVMAFWFTWRYLGQQEEIQRQQEDMRLNPIELPVDNPALLKARVDSLQAAHRTYTHALHIIDSLLLGSDRWTRLHEQVTRSTHEIGGIWLTTIRPVGTGSIQVDGTALSRTRIAQFARRHLGRIEKASSIEIKHENRDVRLYEFVMVAPLPSEMPRVAEYLQAVSDGSIADAAVDSVLNAYMARSLYAPGHAPPEDGDEL